MRMTIVVGSLFAVFLLLMVSNVNSVEYSQVSSDINKKISVLRGEIKRLYERVTEEHILFLNKLAKNKNISNIFDKVTSTFDNICFPCQECTWDPACLALLFDYYLYVFLALLFSVTVVLMPIAIQFLWEAINAYSWAHSFGCVWAWWDW